jgi:hypothetical protein
MRAALVLTLLVIAACGTTIRPRLGGVTQPSSRLDSPTDPAPTVEKVCRSHATRSGWITTSYFQNAETCPKSSDSTNAYNGAIIERYSQYPVGTTMVVCADQPVPRRWVREYGREAGTACPGASVPDGEVTAMVIRRVTEEGAR